MLNLWWCDICWGPYHCTTEMPLAKNHICSHISLMFAYHSVLHGTSQNKPCHKNTGMNNICFILKVWGWEKKLWWHEGSLNSFNSHPLHSIPNLKHAWMRVIQFPWGKCCTPRLPLRENSSLCQFGTKYCFSGSTNMKEFDIRHFEWESKCSVLCFHWDL